MNPLATVFSSHYAELRTRLIRSFLAIFLCSCLAYLFKDLLASLCMGPLLHAYPQTGKLVYTNLTEAFISYIKLALLCGTMLSFPFLLYQAWMFITPGLIDKERRLVSQVLFWGTMLFLAGGLFAFFVVLPRLLHYFMGYAGPNLIPMLKLGTYLGFTARMVFAFAIAFEIPFLMVMAVRADLTTAKYFTSKRFYFYSAILVLSFLLSAGDIASTILLTFPLMGLYETGILANKVLGKGTEQ